MKRKNNLFTQVPVTRPKRNLFDLSHEVKMSAKFSFLYPILVQDVVPGDTVRDQATVFARFAPMLAPIMHRCNISVHTFMVPYRILTDHWEDFITGGQDGTDAPVLPYITPAGIRAAAGNSNLMKESTLWDYMGLPVLQGADPGVFVGEQISVLPFKAYAKIWNDYYRDPNLDTELDLDVEVAGNVSANAVANSWLTLRARGWNKDYFTSALPWAQRGAEVLMPLSGLADVEYMDISQVMKADGTANSGRLGVNPLDTFELTTGFEGGTPAHGRIENIESVEFTNSSVSINDFRASLAIQRWLENNARGGGRYIEQIESHFAVRVPDYRLQRAEYLGGGKQPVQISEVLATADSEDVPVGDMAGHGISVGKSNRFTYRCQEHGVILSILSVMPDSAYSQGVDKMWMKTNKFDFAWPELAHLGEQPIYSKEVFFSFNNADDSDNQEVFGYIPRYSEYKFKNDRIAGDFRSNLGFWHLGRNFAARPVLNSAFTTMQENAPTLEETFRRIFAVQDGTDYIWMQIFHNMTAKRPLPYFGVPRII